MHLYDGSSILKIIRLIQATAEPEETVAALSRFVEGYGFGRIFIGQLINPENVPLKDILYMSDWPDELKALRQNQVAILHDPVAICALRSRRPFTWAEARSHALQLGRMVVDTVHGFGMNDGIMFPMHALHSLSGGVSLGARFGMDLSPTEIAELEIVCQTAYYHLEGMLGPFPYQKLAEQTAPSGTRPRGAADGRTGWEFVRILGVQENRAPKARRCTDHRTDTAGRSRTRASTIARDMTDQRQGAGRGYRAREAAGLLAG